MGWTNDTANLFNAIFKSSNTSSENKASVFKVTSESGDKAELNYHSKTIAQLGNSKNNYSGGGVVASPVVDEFAGEFTSKLGQQSVNNVEEFKAYNAALIAALESGELKMTSEEYRAELNLARTNTSIPIYADDDAIASDDAVRGTVNRDTVSYIHGTGKDAIINIDKDANLQLWWSDASLINLENGATLINDGTLGTAYNTLRGPMSLPFAVVLYLRITGLLMRALTLKWLKNPRRAHRQSQQASTRLSWRTGPLL
ncbi:hypothetical protein CEW81_19405 [Kluyvera genomosp. 3]|uniref:Uncharacterized protein n=1 Tax=Kluyvera genomosp. 3 TaxID=2774055 RepID=A0A248KKG2_9ENTR|nr:hypothetical protein CEW81_19405 [Kluyvera genomosp. 3]